MQHTQRYALQKLSEFTRVLTWKVVTWLKFLSSNLEGNNVAESLSRQNKKVGCAVRALRENIVDVQHYRDATTSIKVSKLYYTDIPLWHTKYVATRFT